MATLIESDGSERHVSPASPEHGFTLTELYALIDCKTVEAIGLTEQGRSMWLDENGKLNAELRVNMKATDILHRAGGSYADYVVGRVLICEEGEVR